MVLRQRSIFALVDCNNFFVSCERVFRPDLLARPVAVLSNNDGCVVARSNEVKALGVPMGAPYFKHKSVFERHGVKTFSANFRLYGDMSQRVAQTLGQFSPQTEMYSIDESFLDLSDLEIEDLQAWSNGVAKVVKRHTGIPVSVGVGASKTLAKAATELVKQERKDSGGGLSLVSLQNEYPASGKLKNLPVGDVWGIGRRFEAKMLGYGIRTAYDLAALNDRWVRQQLGVVGLRAVKELRGESCFGIHQGSSLDGQKSISATRSFGKGVGSLHQLESAVASFVARVAVKLRSKDQLAWQMGVFIQTNRHRPPYQTFTGQACLTGPSSNTTELTRQALTVLRRMYDSDFSYKRAGVFVNSLVSADSQQLPLVGDASNMLDRLNSQDRLMAAVDSLNSRYRGAIGLAVRGVDSRADWQSRRRNVSPAYTTSWNELPRVGAKGF